jgi:uncharacterized protein YgiM (DUF1202 family)
MGRITATLAGVLVLALLAGVLTEASLALGHRGQVSDDAKARPAVSTKSPSPKSSASATPTPTSAPTPAATPALRSATTNSFVHMRAGKSLSSTILLDLNGGTVVYLLPDADAQWQQVQYSGATGYIFKTYLTY